VVNKMLTITVADGKPVAYRNFLRNRFAFREVVVAPTPLSLSQTDDLTLPAAITDDEDVPQDRHGCCGTMQHSEYNEDIDATLEVELAALRNLFSKDREFTTKLFGRGTERPAEARAPAPSRTGRSSRPTRTRKR